MKKRVFSLLLCMALAITMAFAAAPPLDVTAATGVWNVTAKPAGFTGSGPYSISSADGLAYFAYLVNSGINDFDGETVNLTANINISARYWVPIGQVEGSSTATSLSIITAEPFKGTFNGGGHYISGMTISDSGNQNFIGGLFGVNDGIIKNVGVIDADVNTLRRASGIASGNRGVIENCMSTGIFHSDGSSPRVTGGIVGENAGTVLNCYSNALVIDQKPGGVVGINVDAGSMENCFFTGYADGTNAAADARSITTAVGTGSIENCYYLAGSSSGSAFPAGFADPTNFEFDADGVLTDPVDPGDELLDMLNDGGSAFKILAGASNVFPVLSWENTYYHEDVFPIPGYYRVSVSGSYAASNGAGSYEEDDLVTINAGTRSGYSFTGWTVNSGGVSLTNAGSATTTFTMPAANVAVTAGWEVNGPTTPPANSYVSVGGATPANYDFVITGAVKEPVYFTMDGLKAKYAGLTDDYYWLNSYTSTGTDTMTGVYLETVLKDTSIVQLVNAESITVTAVDGYAGNFNLDTSSYGVYGTAIDGTKMMLAWHGPASRGSASIIDYTRPRLIVGQKDADHINRRDWVEDIKVITVKTNKTSHPGSPGSYVPMKDNKDNAAGEAGGAGVPEVSIEIEAKVEVEDAIANATNSGDDIKAALAELDKEAGKAGADKVLKLDATTDDDTDKTVYTLPADALSLLTGDGSTGVELVTDQGSIIFSAGLLKYLEDIGSGALVIEIENVETADGLAAVNITIKIGNAIIGSFNGIMLKAEIPLDPDSSTQPDGLIVYHVAAGSQKTLIKLAAYDSLSKSMKLGLLHLSQYSIEYNPVTFADIQKHWGRSSIEFLAARNIVNGRSVDSFDPDGKVTRAEFVKMLAESVDGVDVSGAASAGFSDIPGGAWYAGYVNWAAGLGIVQGDPDGTFRPDGLITREQMAAMTGRFIRAMKYDLKVVQSAAIFTDQDQISSFATSTVREMQQYGIMNGNPDGSFNPKGTATRAESAKVIKTFIEAVLR